jgi:predicted membrane-bound spermidine synthase
VKVNLFQEALSYLVPIKIWKGSGTINPVLELFLYRGEWQLATTDAVYSDGTRYRPLIEAFRKTEKLLPPVKNVLVLGSGLGSAVHILDKKGFYPTFTLVDKDEKVLELALLLLKPSQKHRVTTVCADAEEFVEQNDSKYDLIIVDLFFGRVVPAFVSTEDFIKKCRNCLNNDGIFIMNYMLNNEEDQRRFSLAQAQFPTDATVIDIGINKVLVAIV